MYRMGLSRIVGMVLVVCFIFLLSNPLVMGFGGSVFSSVRVNDVSYSSGIGNNVSVSMLVEINDLIVEVGDAIGHVRNLVVSARVARVPGVEGVDRMLNNATLLYLTGVNLFLSGDYNGSISYLRVARSVVLGAWDSAIGLVYNYLRVRLDAGVLFVNVLNVWVLNASSVVSGVDFTRYVSGLGVVRDYFDRAVLEFRLYSPVNRSTSDHLADALTYYVSGYSVLSGLVIVLSSDVNNFIGGLRYNASVVLSGFELDVRRVSEHDIMIPDDVSLLLRRAKDEFAVGDRAYNSVNRSDVNSWNGYLTAVVSYQSVINDVRRARLLLLEYLRNVAANAINNALESLNRTYNVPGVLVSVLDGERVRLAKLQEGLVSAIDVDDLLDIINRARLELSAINVIRGALVSLNRAYDVPGVSVGALNDERVKLNELQRAFGSAVSVDDLLNVISQGKVIQRDVEYIVGQATTTVTGDVTNVVMSVFVVLVFISIVLGLIVVNRRFSS